MTTNTSAGVDLDQVLVVAALDSRGDSAERLSSVYRQKWWT